MKILIISVFSFFLILIMQSCSTNQDKPRIIFDTDIGGDADDLAALVMLHNFVDKGECELLGVACWSNEQYAVPAIDAVNKFYGHPDVPVGVRQTEPATVDWFYNRAVAENFPYEKTRDNVPDAVSLYREILAGEKDTSVTVVTVGPLKNIQDLIQSGPDDYSSLDGRELIRKKVKEFVIMGGKFPHGEDEWNFDGNMPGVTKFVLENLTVPVVFFGYEIGVRIKTGAEIVNMDKNTPLYVGYDYFGQNVPYLEAPPEGEIINNSSYDQTAVLYAVRGGVGEYWEPVSNGCCIVDDFGNNKWEAGKACDQSYMVLTINPDEMARLITSFMLNEF